MLLLLGSFFILVTAIGMLRLGDVFSRLHVTTKAGTMGLVGVLLASMLFFWGAGELHVKHWMALWFLVLTAPVAAHVLSSVAYRTNHPRWDRTKLDEADPYLPRRTPGDPDEPGSVA